MTTEGNTPLPERNLDILRATAVVYVIGDHLGLAMLPLDEHPQAHLLGRLGVLLFFVHASLVLMSSLERQGPRKDWIKTFYVRRAMRIYPLAIACVVLVLAIPAAGRVVSRGEAAWPYVPTNATTAISNLALLQNLTDRPSLLAPLWSLPIEVQMYALLPFCFIVARRRTRWVVTLLAGAVIAYLIVRYVPVRGIWRLNVFYFGPAFVAGIIAYHLMRRRVKPRLPWWTLPIVLAASFALLLVVHADSSTIVRQWVAPLGIGLVLPHIKESPRFRFSAVAHTICTYSYGIYLLHVPVIWIAVVVLHDQPLVIRVLVGCCGVVVLPWVAYHAIENPGIQIGRRLVHLPLARAATAPPP